MKKVFLLLTVIFFSACNNYKIEDLYGTWVFDNIELTFNKDKTMERRIGAEEIKGRYNTFGNSLELIGPDNKVIGSVAIKSLINDTLILDLIHFKSTPITFTRKKTE